MSKKLGWLDAFAEEQAKKMEKVAALNKKAEQVIVDPEDVPGAADGAEITYQGEAYKVLNANFSDEAGPGVVLEKVATEVTAALEDEKKDEEVPAEDAKVEDTTPAATANPATETVVPAPAAAPVGTKKVTDAPEIARTNPGDVYDIPVRDTVEVDKFNSEATETANQIAAEDAVDGTTPAGKVNRVLNRMQATPAAPIATEAPVVPATEAPTTDVPAEDAKCETCKNAPCTCEENKEDVTTDDAKAKLANNRIFKKIIATLK